MYAKKQKHSRTPTHHATDTRVTPLEALPCSLSLEKSLLLSDFHLLLGNQNVNPLETSIETNFSLAAENQALKTHYERESYLFRQTQVWAQMTHLWQAQCLKVSEEKEAQKQEIEALKRELVSLKKASLAASALFAPIGRRANSFPQTSTFVDPVTLTPPQEMSQHSFPAPSPPFSATRTLLHYMQQAEKTREEELDDIMPASSGKRRLSYDGRK